MEKINQKEFLFRQPSFPEKRESDLFYYDVANRLLELWNDSGLLKSVPMNVISRMAIGIVGYLQDVVADAGIWRSFVDACRNLYGHAVPFFPESDSYVDYELNREDVRFLVWYQLAMTFEDMRLLSPHNPELLALADLWFGHMEDVYESAPVPEGYNLAHGLEFHDPDDQEKIYHLGNWLFLHCYLMTPAFALTLSGIISDPELMKNRDVVALQRRIEQSMAEDPTGPLAYYVPEWLRLIIEGKMPAERSSRQAVDAETHPYYKKFIEATGGKVIKYFGDYREMNEFFINSMGWDAGQEHLPMMKEEHCFAVMVNPKRGMLVARNVARCISDPDNPYFDPDYARAHAMDFLTVRGRCPADLVKYACSRGWLPGARFEGGKCEKDDELLVKENWDFIARCYLQQYYRD